ncbi:MAG TPA: ornithine carbamoyltransferase [Methanomicrobiales archaeon]|nr:ornithine carbamoyltransferase [Methanomicrobiales archaeon]
MRRDFISILDADAHDLVTLLDSAARMKRERGREEERRILAGKCLAMVFEKASTRTRVSFEVGMVELGGHAIFLNPNDLQLGRGEEIRDMARVLSRYVAGVMIRSFKHGTIEEFARYSTVPVVNGLSDREHPCQILGDLLTLKERFGSTDGLSVAWIGDGNNVCHSLVLASALAGFELAVASPARYRPDQGILEAARAAGGRIRLTADPRDAARDADALYTDVWVSMGEEAERRERLAAFRGYTIDGALLSVASPDAVVLHCLPAHRGEEITDEVIEGPQSIVWDQAENRLHTEKALLAALLGRAVR